MKRHIRRPSRAQACTDKVKMTREYAEAKADELARTQGALMSVYRCPYGCVIDGRPAYHIGHEHISRSRR